jgi:uncharacterized repeat protein (TIGR03803 family)
VRIDFHSSLRVAQIFILLLFFLPCARGDVAFTTLITFNGPNGTLPMAGLLLAKDGNLYGTTYQGGANMKDSDNGAGYGTVFKISTDLKFSTVANLTTSKHPGGNLEQGRDGNFYGTTLQGGELGSGTVFKMSPDGKIICLYSFGDHDENGGINTNGLAPVSLVQGSDGNFYGITTGYALGEGGTLFRINPAGKLTTLFAFSGGEAFQPSGVLLAATDGNFYGTLNSGLLFKLTLTGNLTTNFLNNGAKGPLTAAGLIEGKNEKFFGLIMCDGKSGSVLQMDASGEFSTLVRINGDCPSGELIQATDGNFYGANPLGGTNRMGSLFRLNSSGTMTTLFEFNGRNGNRPNPQLVQGEDGNLYGTTEGGFGTGGSVFRLSLK